MEIDFIDDLHPPVADIFDCIWQPKQAHGIWPELRHGQTRAGNHQGIPLGMHANRLSRSLYTRFSHSIPSGLVVVDCDHLALFWLISKTREFHQDAEQHQFTGV